MPSHLICHTSARRLTATASLIMVGLLGSCGLIDSDITRFDLRVSDKQFTVDTAQWQLATDSTFPAIDCTQMQGICSGAISQACGNDGLCFGSCDGTNCKALVLVSLFQGINLQTERPELQQVAKQPLIEVSVERVFYTIEENTLNIPTPELQLYVAPGSVTNAGDPQAKLIGTIQPIAAGDTPTEKDLVFAPDGKANLREFMGDWRTDFNVIVGGQVSIEAGDPMPAGALKALITVDAFANL